MTIGNNRRMMVACVFVLLFSQMSVVLAQDDNQTVTAMSDAEESLAKAFQNVCLAEKAGGNVSQLVTQLNLAAQSLTIAYAQLGEKNYAPAVASSSDCKQIADNITAQATKLYETAIVESSMIRIENALAWLFCVAVITIVTVYGWLFFKKRRCQRIMGMKMEFAPSES